VIRKQTVQTRLLIVLAILTFTLLAGCAVKRNIWGDPTSSLSLTYRMGDNQIFKYQTSSQENQKLEMTGQSMVKKTKISNQFSVQLKGLTEKNFLLGITLENMKINITGGMMGDVTPDLSTLTGKSFDMTLSPLGKEVGFSGIEALQYQPGPSGTRNIKSSFNNIFPDLADKPVKIGDTWTTKEDFTEKAGNLDIHVITDNLNTLQGPETVNGLECVKIETRIKGSFDGKGKQMGSEFTLKGNIKGNTTWYFAYKKGIFISMKANITSEGSVEVSTQGMTIPMKGETSSEINLIQEECPSGLTGWARVRQSLKKPGAPLKIQNSKHEIRNKFE
jgi:hypothetical protein